MSDTDTSRYDEAIERKLAERLGRPRVVNFDGMSRDAMLGCVTKYKPEDLVVTLIYYAEGLEGLEKLMNFGDNETYDWPRSEELTKTPFVNPLMVKRCDGVVKVQVHFGPGTTWNDFWIGLEVSWNINGLAGGTWRPEDIRQGWQTWEDMTFDFKVFDIAAGQLSAFLLDKIFDVIQQKNGRTEA